MHGAMANQRRFLLLVYPDHLPDSQPLVLASITPFVILSSSNASGVPRTPSINLCTQAYCCSSGVIKLRAELFYEGLAFRAPGSSECQAVSGALFCDDMHRAGFRHVVVDPGVRLARQLQAAEAVRRALPGLPIRAWADVVAAPPYWLTHTPNYGAVDCCASAPGASRDVATQQVCRPVDVLSVAVNASQLV